MVTGRRMTVPTRPNLYRPGRCRGFTLVEVMLVVLVLAIVAAVATARMGKSDVQKLVAAAQLLAADLAFAQVESITHGEDPRVVVFNTPANAPHGYHIAAAATPNTAIINPVGKMPYEVRFGFGRAAPLDGVTITGQSVGGDGRLGFGLYGQLDQTINATITLACGGKSIMLTVNAVTGETTIGNVQ
jgi:prepilin-type N-terminal cleavage/methylation domain-containing protein